jgi:hypothetical protein
MKEQVLFDDHIIFSLQTDIQQICQPILIYPFVTHVSWFKLYKDGRLQILMCDPKLLLHQANQHYIIVPNVDLKLVKQKFYYFIMPSLNDGYEQALSDILCCFK